MMTREEAIKTFEDILQLSPTLDETGCSVTEAMKVALSALRPVSREQVEQMRSRWVPLNNTQEHFCESCGVAFNLYAYCKNDYQFCPACGAPITDEAVDIVMRRLEALKDGL